MEVAEVRVVEVLEESESEESETVAMRVVSSVLETTVESEVEATVTEASVVSYFAFVLTMAKLFYIVFEFEF